MDLYNFAMAVKAGSFGSVVWNGSCEMRKRNNPYLGRVQKLVRASNIQFAVSYENDVNNERERNGLERDFKAAEHAWGTYAEGEYPRVLRKRSDMEKMYLPVTFTNNSKFEVVYLLDGRIATKEETEEIMSFLYKKQDYENSLITIKFENVIRCKSGACVFEKSDVSEVAKSIW